MINDFQYLKPASLKEALAMYAEHDDCKVICGGQSLLIVLRQGMLAPEYLVDIKHVNELKYIKFDEKDGLRIGATTTHREVEKSDIIAKKYPALVAMEQKLASIQTRNWGTIGGNLAHADPAGDLAPVLIALNAEIKFGNVDGEKTVPRRVLCRRLRRDGSWRSRSGGARSRTGAEIRLCLSEIQSPRQRDGYRCRCRLGCAQRRRHVQKRPDRSRQRRSHTP